MKPEKAETIGDRIKRLREERSGARKLTQADLAKAMGVQEKQISKWENDEVKLNADRIIRLADYFGVSVDYLVRGGRAENLIMINETGLSDQTIERLKKHQANGKKTFAAAINLLMNPDNGFGSNLTGVESIGEELLRMIFQYVSKPDKQIRAVDVSEPNLMDFISTDDLFQIHLLNLLSALKMVYQEMKN